MLNIEDSANLPKSLFKRLTGVKRRTYGEMCVLLHQAKAKQKRLLSVPKKQRAFYSGKKKRHTLKTQIAVDKADDTIICSAHDKGPSL